MKSSKEYTQQTVTRVLDFGKRHADLFPNGAAAGELLGELEQDVNILSGHSSAQVSGDGAIRKSRGFRDAARKALQFKLARRDQTARALKISDFFMRRSRSDNALTQSGNAFATAAA